jgi:hypothetical protein|tara:strand:+ start:2187 stop:2765 length:579 start_codon:yes stop_codon:yes gene_type:complete
MQIGDYIKVYDNMLSEKVCSDLIALFNNEQYPVERIDNKLHPLFTQMHVTQVLGEDHKLHRQCLSVFKSVLERYKSDVNHGGWIPPLKRMEDFRIKHYATGTEDQFAEHIDNSYEGSMKRCLALFFYLNDTTGGETVFTGMKKVSPQRGRVVVFPPMWMFPHAGLPVTGENDKFLLSTYLHYPPLKEAEHGS